MQFPVSREIFISGNPLGNSFFWTYSYCERASMNFVIVESETSSSMKEWIFRRSEQKLFILWQIIGFSLFLTTWVKVQIRFYSKYSEKF